MALFNFGKKKSFFTDEQQEKMLEAIRQAEKNTSGEVRVFVESRCKFVNPVDRAEEIFFNLQMQNTQERNGVLLYLAIKDQQLALFADEGIYKAMGKEYWQTEVKKILAAFTKDDYAGGICLVVNDIGQALKEKFPYQSDDKNELPDEIIFGK